MDNGLRRHASATDLNPSGSRLACQACQRKKIKCDRTFPCAHCTKSNLQCVPSTRKPRARHAGKRAVDSELRNRISKLEGLVESLTDEGAAQPGDGTNSDALAGAGLRESTPIAGKYVASPFWSSLTTEVQALRDALEDEDDEEDEGWSPPVPEDATPRDTMDYDLVICPPGSIYVMPGALTEPTHEQSVFLCQTFCDNVDRLFKTFHAPTLRAFMMEGKSYLGQVHDSLPNRALKTAIWYAAVNTLPDEQIQRTFGQSRTTQLQLFRRSADVALAQADLMNTTDIATLQAFCTYLLCARSIDRSRRTWTLFALAVRIARAMGLHQDGGRTPFETELRRRLWHQVRFLDMFGGLDRGTELMIAIGSFDTPIPKCTYDSEFDEYSTTIPEYNQGLTEVSFAHMNYETSAVIQRLAFAEIKADGDTWQQRLEIANQFEARLRDKYLRHCDHNIPYDRMIFKVGSSMCVCTTLRAIRPTNRHVSSTPPRVDTTYVLKLATDCLKAGAAIGRDPDLGKWRWMKPVQWHPLAVALAGLCAIRDTDLANEAWPFAEAAYGMNKRFVADEQNGMLWRPIEKLYKKAKAFRNHEEATSANSTPMSQLIAAGQNSSPPQPLHQPNPNAATAAGPTHMPQQQQPQPQPQQHPQQQSQQQPHLQQQQRQQPTPQPVFTTHNLASALPPAHSNPMLPPPPLPQQPMSTPANQMPTQMDFPTADLNWMDFERILEDLNGPVITNAQSMPAELAHAQAQAQAQAQADGGWWPPFQDASGPGPMMQGGMQQQGFAGGQMIGGQQMGGQQMAGGQWAGMVGPGGMYRGS